MDLSSLKPAAGSVRKQGKRLGRGQGSGRGGTATKGHKGQQSRAGYAKVFGFEGGQMPLQRRVPKYGFKNIFRKEYKAVNLETLEAFAEKTGIVAIDVETMKNAGLVPKNSLVKVLGNGALTKKLEVKAHAFSNSAKTAIEALEGTVTVVK